MPGPVPKSRKTRQRTNRRSTAASLVGVVVPIGVEPDLPDERNWHPLTLVWWSDVWASPMAAEFLQSDVHGLLLLAVLVDQFWVTPTQQLAGEIRLQRQCFGLTPIDRRRLEWEIERAESSKKRAPEVEKPKRKRADPRRGLVAV